MSKLLLTFFLMITCFSNFNHAEEPLYCRLVDNINSKFNKEIREEYGYTCAGGGGGFMKDVSKIAIDYKCYNSYSVDELRKILIEMRERYLKIINEDEELRPYLHEYPFSQVNFSICCRNAVDGSFIDEPFIAAAWINSNCITYYINKLENGFKLPFPNYKEALKETLEEALQRVDEKLSSADS